MKKSILSVLMAFFVLSCSLTKDIAKSNKTNAEKTVERRTFTRPGDTVSIDIPNINFKDTTITRVNYDTRTIASVRYDGNGNARFDCISAEMREEMELIRETLMTEKNKDKKVDSEFNPQLFIYAIGFLVLVIIIAMIVFMFMISRIQKSIPETIHGLLNK